MEHSNRYFDFWVAKLEQEKTWFCKGHNRNLTVKLQFSYEEGKDDMEVANICKEILQTLDQREMYWHQMARIIWLQSRNKM